jgi:hypothetical protein
MNYDFHNLSPTDFEELVRDLLQKEFGCRLESFKSGKDRGIDIRYARDPKAAVVIQCKHYVRSGFGALRSTMLSSELPKIQKLNPQRYILVTSVPLSVSNKDDLLHELSPYLQSTHDILGAEDLNNLLGKFPEVEKAHFKLWLASSAILERIVHSEVFNRTTVEINAIKAKLQLYVKNASFSLARKILAENHVCVISGIPGIGKTTLAQMLIIQYLSEGWEAICLGDDLSNALKVMRRGAKQIFYYDDFLGRTQLGDKLGKNEDDLLIRLFRHIKNDPQARLVLTTREYILQQARIQYERLSTEDFDVKKCIVSLESYSKIDRARILFNHLYFSNLPQKSIDELLEQQSYLLVIEHRNFSPRVISALTVDLDSIPEGSYSTFFLGKLQNPVTIWSHAFEREISNAGRVLLLALVTFGSDIYLDDLRQAFQRIYREFANENNWQTRYDDFDTALKEVEGTFTISARPVTNGNVLESIRIRFANPSIMDYLENYLRDNKSLAVRLASVASFFVQVERIHHILTQKQVGAKCLPELVTENLLAVMERPELRREPWSFNRSSIERRAIFIVQNIDLFRPPHRVLLSRAVDTVIEKVRGHDFDVQALVSLLEVLPKIESGHVHRQMELVELTRARVLMATNSEEGLRAAFSLNELLPDLFDKSERDDIWEQASDYVNEELRYLRVDEADLDSLESRLVDVEGLATLFDLDIVDPLEELGAYSDELRKRREEEEIESYSPERMADSDRNIYRDTYDKQEVHDLFGALRERAQTRGDST